MSSKKKIVWLPKSLTRQGHDAGAAVPVFQVDAAVFDSDHCADVAGLCVLNDHAEFNRMLG